MMHCTGSGTNTNGYRRFNDILRRGVLPIRQMITGKSDGRTG